MLNSYSIVFTFKAKTFSDMLTYFSDSSASLSKYRHSSSSYSTSCSSISKSFSYSSISVSSSSYSSSSSESSSISESSSYSFISVSSSSYTISESSSYSFISVSSSSYSISKSSEPNLSFSLISLSFFLIKSSNKVSYDCTSSHLCKSLIKWIRQSFSAASSIFNSILLIYKTIIFIFVFFLTRTLLSLLLQNWVSILTSQSHYIACIANRYITSIALKAGIVRLITKFAIL